VIELRKHPLGEQWPTQGWPVGNPESEVDTAAAEAALQEIRDTPEDAGLPLATVVVHRGRMIYEQYAPGFDAASTFISWSVAKSMVHAVFGILVGDGRIDIDVPAPVPDFVGTNKASITVRDLLAMKPGLEFNEDYVDESTSHCIDMLFGAGSNDHAHYAASQQLLHKPGTVWNYASGTTNILARIAGDIVGGGDKGMRDFLNDRLFAPLGMSSAEPKFDAAGTFVGSSYVFATAQDFARFGYLYARDGQWEERRLLPAGWVDYARTLGVVDPDPPHFGYGAHWWIWTDQPGSFAAHGYEGQYVIVIPERDLVVVQLSKVPSAFRPPLVTKLRQLINAFPSLG
jgi:CubicO group peptidase (beta-lactamase class C family)